MLNRRLQVLLDQERWDRLQARSAASGASVGSVVRRALDEALPPTVPEAQRAASELLKAAPMPVDDWPSTKQELTDARGATS